MRIIPAIDLKDGKCVRLFKGDFAKTTEYSADPASVARRFSALDVQDLHIVDLDGARTGTQNNQSIVAEIAAQSGLAIQLGGGIRKRD
ncbi:MAG: 1-(5-phosphoribosyl)-5-((5-phosphoribosylamino)methylideneamino)imidazole-4-carboxamide isomerase, partial [Chromatiales bacterium]